MEILALRKCRKPGIINQYKTAYTNGVCSVNEIWYRFCSILFCLSFIYLKKCCAAVVVLDYYEVKIPALQQCLWVSFHFDVHVCTCLHINMKNKDITNIIEYILMGQNNTQWNVSDVLTWAPYQESGKDFHILVQNF